MRFRGWTSAPWIRALAVVAAVCATPAAFADVPPLGLLPIENLTGETPDLERFREALGEVLLERGIPTVDEGVIDTELARRRVRFVGGLDDETALGLRQATGAASFLSLSLEVYDASENPRLAVAARLMAVEDAGVRPVWASSYHLAGDDHPGFLGLGLVRDVAVLEDRVLEALGGDLATWMTRPPEPAKPAKPPPAQRRFRTRSLYFAQGSTPDPQGTRKVVVLPFRNQSLNPHAGEILAIEITQELLQEGRHVVVERGVVRRALLDLRIIQEGGISLAQADVLRALLDADVVVTGTVSDWRDASAGTPTLVGFTAYAVDTRSQKVAWLSRSREEGTAGASLFGTREVRTTPALARELVRGLLKEIASETRKESRDRSR